MEIFKILLSFGNSADMYTCDAIEYQNQIWYVPKWLNYPAEANKKPERIIAINQFDLVSLPNSWSQSYRATQQVPEFLRSAVNQYEISAGYVVQFLPDLTFPIQS